MLDSPTQPVRRPRGRPRKDDDTRSDVRELLLRAGVAALTEKGFAATGLDEILKSVAVPKGSFYHYFKSKEDFGLALIDRYDLAFSHRLDRSFKNIDLSPFERLQDFVYSAEDGMRRYEFSRGCLVGNLGQEMGNLPSSFRARLIEVFEGWQDKMANCIRDAQAHGEISGDRDADLAAAFFWIGWEGAVLRAKLERSAAPLRVFAQEFFRGLRR